MKTAKPFFDSNVLLYLFSEDSRKADRAEAIIAKGGLISVQVLNEFASVSARKFKMSYPEIRESLQIIRAVCQVEPVSLAIHEQGLENSRAVWLFTLRQYDCCCGAAIGQYGFVFGRDEPWPGNQWAISDL